MDRYACPWFRFGPLKHKPGHQFDSLVDVSFRSSDSMPLRTRDRILGPLCVICAINMSAMAWRISSTGCHKFIMCSWEWWKKVGTCCWERWQNDGTMTRHAKYQCIEQIMGNHYELRGVCHSTNTHRLMSVGCTYAHKKTVQTNN
jgi:hypothetical protein